MSAVEPIIETPAEAQQSNQRMTYEEYLAWADEDTHAEWVNGEVIVHMPSTAKD